MLCDCGQTSTLTANEYFEEADSCRMRCQHCDGSIHFGPAVAAVRDEHDPALRDDCVPGLAWYHTSTDPAWPSEDYAARFEAELKWVDRDFGPSRESHIARETSKALHVGTYEAAIENMLRRMNDQGDGDSQFYLYRVGLRIAPGRINQGYRDENHAVAAKISLGELDAAGLDAVRYLNVHEAIGTLSLAVRPDAIWAVQRLPIPVSSLSIETTCAAVDEARNELVAAVRALRQAEEAASLAPGDRRMMQLGARPDPGGVARRIGDLELQYYRCWNELEEHLSECVLPGASPVVRRDFNDAAASMRGAGGETEVDQFVDRYRQLAALLERRDAVLALISNQEWRRVARES